jgi:magnesium chelatase subunit I
MIPRTNRGIFCINELPDLAERIQVGLLNIMEERDVQIRGYKIRLPLDVYVVASANPEDYTNRGRIITPLKDRVGSEIRTHYPRTVEHEMQIMEAESSHFPADGLEVLYPQFMKEVIAEFTQLARRSNDISQRSGVSVRVSISNYENVLSNASRRSLRLRERYVAPRVSDLSAIIASTAGKIELDTVGDVKEERIIQKLINAAVLSVFGDYFEQREFDQLVAGFERGLSVQVGDDMSSMEYVNQLSKVGGLSKAIDKLNGRGNPASIASAIEFILEGLHLNRRLNKEATSGKVRYRR